MHPPLRRSRTSNQGMVLVVMLAMIVLVTIAVMAFFTHASANRKVESSRSAKTEAELLAQSGESYVLARLFSEITNSAFSTETNGIFIPKDTNVVPVRRLSSSIPLGSTNFLNLVRQSISTDDGNVSSDRTSDASRNGRMVGPNRWNAPRLLSASGFTNDSQLPQWIYITKNGGPTNSPGSGQVIGRIAYNAYNIGGLLNVNSAGFPTALAGASGAHLKGYSTGIELVGNIPGMTDPSANDKLIEFRNAGVISASDPDAYLARIRALVSDGYNGTSVTNGTNNATSYTNNAFTGRQDLIRYARTENPTLLDSLPYLTHFSRAINGPSWVPSTPTIANPMVSGVRVSSGKVLKHYDDYGNDQEYEIDADEPLVQRKFSLAKLAWLSPTGIVDSAMPGLTKTEREQAVLDCFGLDWNDEDERWDYVAERTSGPEPNKILPLSEVATATNREPNFFEYLSAAIAEGSIGKSFSTSATVNDVSTPNDPVSHLLQRNKSLHILRIGACIIDAADSDNYPTVISYPLDDASGEGERIEVAGVEDLPYLYALSMNGPRAQKSFTHMGATKSMLLADDLVMVPQFITPHRLPTFNTTNGPTSVQARFADDSKLNRTDIIINKYRYNFPGSLNLADLSHPTNQGVIEIPSSEFNDYRSAPKARRATDKTDGNRLENLCYYTDPDTGETVPNIATNLLDVEAFRLFSWQRDHPANPRRTDTSDTTNGWKTGWYNNPKKPAEHFLVDSSITDSTGGNAMMFMNMNFVLQYKTPKSNWKTYYTLGGNEKLPSGINGSENDGTRGTGVQYLRCTHFHIGGATRQNLNSDYNLFTFDPRSNRAGPANYRSWPFEAMPGFSRYASNDTGAKTGNFPEAGKNSSEVLTGSGNTDPSNFADPDGVFRPPDAYLRSASLEANPYRKLSSPTALDPSDISRPVVLQRPFRSVAELGYVFRDDVWKTISFFDETSGDAALLDYFSVTDMPAISSDRVSLNTPQKPILNALFSGVGREPSGADALSPTLSSNLANALSDYLYDDSTGAPKATLLRNSADIVKFMTEINERTKAPYPTTGSLAAGDSIKSRREVVVRALADKTQTRTWNFLVDVVAQTGQFPPGKSAAADFIVEAESRSWTSVAIDRYTARLVDLQRESVNE